MGSKNPSAEILINIAVALGVSVDELLSDLDFPQRDDSDVFELLRSCSPEEQVIFKELITFMKPVLRKFDL